MVFPKLFKRRFVRNNDKVNGSSESLTSVLGLLSSSQTLAPGTSINTSVIPGTTYTYTTSTDTDGSLKIDYGNEYSSSSPNEAYGAITTVFSQKPATFTPSIQIDTITTDALPSNYYAASNSSSCSLISNSSISFEVINSSTYPSQSIWNSKYYSNSKYNASSNLNPYSSSTTSESVSVYADPSPSSITKSRRTNSYIPTKTSTHKSETTSSSSITSLTSSITPRTSSTIISSSITLGPLTTTVIQYYEDLTYTQVYVVTDTETTITTSVLATTSFIVTDQSETYSIMPPAITTDMAAFKSTHDFANLISSSGLSKGSIAGIVVGVILGVLFFSVFIFFISRKRHANKRKQKKSNFSNNNNDDNLDSSKNYENYDDPELGDDGDFEEHLPELQLSKIREKSKSLDQFNSSSALSSPPPLFIKPPPVPKRTLKPISFDSPISSPNELEFPITPTQNHDSDNYLSPIDTSLFDMKSTIESMGSPIALQQTPIPVPPPSRKSSPNAINKMSHNILRATPPPDRTMDILYETPNEGGNESFWEHKNRFRSSSVAKRYESLSSNVSSFKNELEKDKINSPISPPPVPKPRKNLNLNSSVQYGNTGEDDSGVVDTLLFLNTVQKKDKNNDTILKRKNVYEKKKESENFEFGSDDDIDTDELSSSIDSV